MREHTIDAKGEYLGRVAARVAHILQGKNSPDFAPNKEGADRVTVKNAGAIKISGKKAAQKIYYRHSTRPGGLKRTTYKEAFSNDPEWVLRHAVSGMLPKNRLRSRRIKNLVVEK